MSDLKPGWLHKQMERNAREFASWPAWMRKAANIDAGTYTAAKGDAEHEKGNAEYAERIKDTRRLSIGAACRKCGLKIPACPHCGKELP